MKEKRNITPIDDKTFDFVETCPICKKTFIPAPMHVYKDQRPIIRGETSNRKAPLVCSYPCYRMSEKLADEEDLLRRSKKISKEVWSKSKHEMQNTSKTEDT